MIPLADRMRPKNLSEYIGQKHIISEDKLLFKAIKNNQLFSMVFWGPPGSGKTTLARVIANEIEADFAEFSAVSTGIAEVKKLFEKVIAEHNPMFPRKTVVFIDEIHRFSKAQQDAFLPYVENGLITLIGATTENPSFEIINPLLSRTRVLTLKALEREDIELIVKHALKDKERGLGNFKVKVLKEALDLLIEASNGDARVVLNVLEIAVSSTLHTGSHSRCVGRVGMKIDRQLIEEALQQRVLSYDKHGEEHHNTISAFIKSMRASNVDSALYYLARMVDAGEDPLFIARRMVIFASEDIGQAQPTALVVANEVFKACETIGYPECQINLAHGVVYLSVAKKDRSAYEAYFKALADVKEFGNLPIPMNLRNAPTKLMKNLGYGEGYEKYTKEDLLPTKLKGKKYYGN
ncbi:MAG: replication-associated recombination protein A [Microgenomates group bacterium]